MSNNYRVQCGNHTLLQEKQMAKGFIYFVCEIEVICCFECDYHMDENNCMFEKRIFLLVDGVVVYMDRLQFNMDGYATLPTPWVSQN